MACHHPVDYCWQFVGRFLLIAFAPGWLAPLNWNTSVTRVPVGVGTVDSSVPHCIHPAGERRIIRPSTVLQR